MQRATCTGYTEKSTRSTGEGGLGSGRRLHARFTMKGLAGKISIFPLQSKLGIDNLSGTVSPLCTSLYKKEFMVFAPHPPPTTQARGYVLSSSLNVVSTILPSRLTSEIGIIRFCNVLPRCRMQHPEFASRDRFVGSKSISRCNDQSSWSATSTL